MGFIAKIRAKLTPLPEFVSTGDYMADYRRHSAQRARRDPREAVGAHWNEIGALQFEFLKREGLKPSDRLLDIGCGSLRGGRHFIRYLEPGHYTGTEMVPELISAGRRLIAGEGLTDKGPRIIHIPDGNFRFDGLPRFDFILAQSVFTHLKPPMIEECFANIGKVMGRFYFTYLDPAIHTDTAKDFAYPLGFFAELGRKNGLTVEDVSDHYPHPRNQRMAGARH